MRMGPAWHRLCHFLASAAQVNVGELSELLAWLPVGGIIGLIRNVLS